MALCSLNSFFLALNYSPLKNKKQRKDKIKNKKQTIVETPWIFRQWCPCGYKKYTAVLFTEAMICNIVPVFNRM